MSIDTLLLLFASNILRSVLLRTERTVMLYLFITVNYDGLLATGRVLFYTLHNGSYVRNMALLMVRYVVQS